MVVYHASEKDCVGEDGEGGQECVICFEEFAVGDEMGRLECLCKFHKVCLKCPRLDHDQANSTFRHVYDNGGIQKVRDHARCIRVGFEVEGQYFA